MCSIVRIEYVHTTRAGHKSGAERLGGPSEISGTGEGGCAGSSGGMLVFDPTFQRPSLLPPNGVVYLAFVRLETVELITAGLWATRGDCAPLPKHNPCYLLLGRTQYLHQHLQRAADLISRSDE